MEQRQSRHTAAPFNTKHCSMLSCKWTQSRWLRSFENSFSKSRLYLPSCSLIGPVRDRKVLINILIGVSINWFDLKELFSRHLLFKCTFFWSRLHLSFLLSNWICGGQLSAVHKWHLQVLPPPYHAINDVCRWYSTGGPSKNECRWKSLILHSNS